MPPAAPDMFGYLVTRLAAHPENVVTDALHYVLTTSPEAARALKAHLRRAADLPGGLHYDVQAAADDGSVPDLAGVAQDGSTPLWSKRRSKQASPRTSIRTLLVPLPA
jgi:hypothetical protein